LQRQESRDLYYAFKRDTPSSTVDAFQASPDILRDEPDQTGVTAHQAIGYRYLGVSHLPPVTAPQVLELVDIAAHAREEDTPGTLAQINAGGHPCRDRENRALYMFVHDTDVTIVAGADNLRLIGGEHAGKDRYPGCAVQGPDRGAGTGRRLWVAVVPAQNGIYEKSAFFRLVEGTDGEQYAVLSGLYTS